MPDELIARARALLRRSGELVDEQNIVYKNIVYDFEKFGVFIDERRIALTVKESMVVEMFMKNINKLLKREQLLSCVW